MFTLLFGCVTTMLGTFFTYKTVVSTSDAIADILRASGIADYSSHFVWILMIVALATMLNFIVKLLGIRMGRGLFKSIIAVSCAMGAIFVFSNRHEKASQVNILMKIYDYIYSSAAAFFAAADDSVSRILLLIFCAILFFGVLFGSATSILGFKNEGRGIARATYYSLPVAFFTLVFYIVILLSHRQKSILYPITKHIETSAELNLILSSRNIDHKKLLKEDPAYIINEVKYASHPQCVYESIANAVGRSALNRPFKNNESPILLAVQTNNENAVRAFLPHIAKSVKYKIGGILFSEDLTLSEIAEREGNHELASLLKP